MAKKKKVGIGNVPTELVHVSPNATRDDIEKALGQVMHQISLQQDVVQKEQQQLKILNAAGNSLDERLKDLDG